MGGMGTAWRGLTFDCENSNIEITLLHSLFMNGTIGTCNNGSIIGRSIGVDNGTCFTPDIIGKRIACIHDDYEYGMYATICMPVQISCTKY